MKVQSECQSQQPFQEVDLCCKQSKGCLLLDCMILYKLGHIPSVTNEPDYTSWARLPHAVTDHRQADLSQLLCLPPCMILDYDQRRQEPGSYLCHIYECLVWGLELTFNAGHDTLTYIQRQVVSSSFECSLSIFCASCCSLSSNHVHCTGHCCRVHTVHKVCPCGIHPFLHAREPNIWLFA